MEKLQAILSDYLIFVIVFALFLVLIFIFALYYGKKSAKKSVYLYGLFLDFKKSHIMSLTLFMMQYLLLCYFLATKKEVTLALCIICISFTLVASILNKNILNVIVNLVMEVVNILVVYFGSLVNTLRIQTDNKMYLILQITIIFTGLVFYTFTMTKYFVDIRKRDLKHVKN